jgi:general stress protein YciG
MPLTYDDRRRGGLTRAKQMTKKERSKGGKARAKKMTKKERSEAGRKGGTATWARIRAALKA